MNNTPIFAALLFLCVTTVAAGTTSEVKSACLAKSIVLKQHTACMYSIPIFVLSSIVTQLVVTLVETILFSSIVYWCVPARAFTVVLTCPCDYITVLVQDGWHGQRRRPIHLLPFRGLLDRVSQ